MPALIFLLFLMLTVAGAVVVFVRMFQARMRCSQQRSEAVQKAAAELGMTFEHRGDGYELQCTAKLPAFPVCRHGVSNIIRGYSQLDDAELRIFDFCYSTRNSSTTSTTVALFRSRRLSLPEFTMRPGRMHFAERLLMQAVNMKDIDFETHPIFSQRYVLQGNDEAK